MLAVIYLLGTFIADLLKARRRLEVENLFLRHQLNIILRRPPQRLRLRGSDRALMVWMTRLPPPVDVTRHLRSARSNRVQCSPSAHRPPSAPVPLSNLTPVKPGTPPHWRCPQVHRCGPSSLVRRSVPPSPASPLRRGRFASCQCGRSPAPRRSR